VACHRCTEPSIRRPTHDSRPGRSEIAALGLIAACAAFPPLVLPCGRLAGRLLALTQHVQLLIMPRPPVNVAVFCLAAALSITAWSTRSPPSPGCWPLQCCVR
jgi:hypothetical protein